MDDLFGQIDYRSKSDAIVMKLLRSAMDKAHENVQSMTGPIEFLHERSKFYELAAILVEGGLNVVQEEADIQETSREKILSDLMEIKDRLQRRNEEMRLLIIEKDKELLERIENEVKLRQAFELNERELVCLREKEELEGFQELLQSSRGIQDEAKEGDICELKNSVDQQVWNIKQKLEDERKSIKNKTRKMISNASDSELYSKRTASSVEGDRLPWDGHFSGVKSQNPGKYNRMIRQMSSDIDILKGTFDIAFGRMQNVEVIPLEKRWKMIIERDTILVSIKGFISHVRKIFDAEFKKRNHYIPGGFCGEEWRELIDDSTALAQALNGLCSLNKVQERVFNTHESSGPPPDMRRTVSDPLRPLPLEPPEEETDASGGHFVAKIIKNHESIIEKNRKELSWLTKEIHRRKQSSFVRRNTEPDELESRIENAVSKLHKIIEWNDNLGDGKGPSDAVTFQKTSIENSEMAGNVSNEISQLKEERDCLNLQFQLREEIYLLLFEDFIKNLKVKLCNYSGTTSIRDDSNSVSLKEFVDDHSHPKRKAGERKEPTSSEMLLQYLDHTLWEDVCAVYMQVTIKEWNKCAECKAEKSLLQEEIYKVALNESVKCLQSTGNLLMRKMESEDSETFSVAIESLLREDVYMVYIREMSKAWKTERDNYDIEMIIREDIYQLFMAAVVKEANVIITRESELSGQTNVSKDFPSVTDLDIHRDESSIGNLDSLLEDHEEDGFLMVNETTQANEQSAVKDPISPSEDADEDKTKKWLLTDGEKLETVLHEVHTSKALLLMLDMENSLGMPSDHQKQDGAIAVESERQNTYCLEEDEELQLNQSVLSPLRGFQQVLVEFEQKMHSNLESKSLRIEELKQQVEGLVHPVSSIKKRELLFKKAFIARCQNLLLAENEVDLLGNQVDKLLCLLERIYIILNQNSTVLSRYFGVLDILNLIKRELSEGAA